VLLTGDLQNSYSEFQVSTFLHRSEEFYTSSSAIAKRPRDASCLLLASIAQYIERKFRYRFTAVYTILLSSVRRSRVAVGVVNCTVDRRT